MSLLLNAGTHNKKVLVWGKADMFGNGLAIAWSRFWICHSLDKSADQENLTESLELYC